MLDGISSEFWRQKWDWFFLGIATAKDIQDFCSEDYM